MATAQPAGDARSAPDIRFRSARRRVLLTSLALGIFGAAALTGAVVVSRLRSIRRGAPEVPPMAKAGNSFVTPLIGHELNFSGHRFHILESARDTDDGSLRFDYTAPPGANISEHVHREQEERFEVVSGKLGIFNELVDHPPCGSLMYCRRSPPLRGVDPSGHDMSMNRMSPQPQWDCSPAKTFSTSGSEPSPFGMGRFCRSYHSPSRPGPRVRTNTAINPARAMIVAAIFSCLRRCHS